MKNNKKKVCELFCLTIYFLTQATFNISSLGGCEKKREREWVSEIVKWKVEKNSMISISPATFGVRTTTRRYKSSLALFILAFYCWEFFLCFIPRKDISCESIDEYHSSFLPDLSSEFLTILWIDTKIFTSRFFSFVNWIGMIWEIFLFKFD